MKSKPNYLLHTFCVCVCVYLGISTFLFLAVVAITTLIWAIQYAFPFLIMTLLSEEWQSSHQDNHKQL